MKGLLQVVIGAVLISGIALGPLLLGELQVVAQINMTTKTTNNMTNIIGNKTGNDTKTSIDHTGGNASGNVSSAEVIISPGSWLETSGKTYDPNTITISSGTTIKWTNKDSTLHTVTSGSPNGENSGTEFDSGYILAGKTFQYAFNTTGTFDYYCNLHPYMKGKVVVS